MYPNKNVFLYYYISIDNKIVSEHVTKEKNWFNLKMLDSLKQFCSLGKLK